MTKSASRSAPSTSDGMLWPLQNFPTPSAKYGPNFVTWKGDDDDDDDSDGDGDGDGDGDAAADDDANDDEKKRLNFTINPRKILIFY